MTLRIAAIAGIAVAVILLVLPSSSRTGLAGGSLGDVNCDGNVNAVDAALILQFSAGLIGPLSCDGGSTTNTPDPSANDILLFTRASLTQLDGLALQEGIEAVTADSNNLDAQLEAGVFGGLISNSSLTRSRVIALYDFVRRGGRAVVFSNGFDAANAEVNEALQEFFGMTLGREEISVGPLLVAGAAHTPLWQGLDVSYSHLVSYVQFYIPASEYECHSFTSETSLEQRCMTAFGRIGSGEVLFMVVGQAGGDLSSICADQHISTLDNEEACLQLVRYLSGQIDYP